MPRRAAPRSAPGSRALAAPQGWAVRLLAVAGGDDPTRARLQVRDFRRFLLLYGAVRSWLWVALSTSSDAPLLGPAALLASTGALLAFHPRGEGVAARVSLPAVAFQALWRFPYTANHLYLELVCVLLLACVRRGSEGEEEALALGALRWTAALVLFHTGLQKLLYGLYFRGEFLAFMVGAEERFGRVFAWLLPDAEVARLASLDRRQTGAGPYRTGSVLLVLASNAVWMAELVLPGLLLARRTRVLGALGGLALMLGIQVAALEVGFALLFVNLLLLFLPGRWNARLLPAEAALLAWALGAALGVLPGHPADWNLL